MKIPIAWQLRKLNNIWNLSREEDEDKLFLRNDGY